MKFLTPGPTQLHPAAKKSIELALADNIGSISHRSEQAYELYDRAEAGVRVVLAVPDDWQLFFLSSATECMERLVQNCVQKSSCHFVNGAFSERFKKIADQLGKKTHTHQVALGKGFDVRDTNIPTNCELISIAMNETSTGVWTDAETIKEIRKNAPDALIVIDVVSALPYAAIPWNDVDAVFFSVQKGFGMPAGLGVLMVNERCVHTAKTLEANNVSTGSYHSFASLQKYAEKHSTPETPNMLGLYTLGNVCDALNRQGLKRLRSETIDKAKCVYDWLETSDVYSPFVTDTSHRSPTVITVTAPDPKKAIEACKQHDIILGSGYGDLKSTTFRIANFPMHTLDDMNRVVDILQTL